MIEEQAHSVLELKAHRNKKNRRKRPARSDRKFPEYLPRYEKIVDLPEHPRAGLKLIGYDEVKTLECTAAELKVRVNKYAKYAHPTDKSQGILSPERPTGRLKATALTLRSVAKSWPGNTFITCRFTGSKTCSHCVRWRS